MDVPRGLTVETAAELFAGVAGLAARAQAAGLAVGVPLALAGLAGVLAGARQRRALATVGLAAVGALSAILLRAPLAAHLGLSRVPAMTALAVLGALVGAVAPAALPFAVAALPGALAGAQVPIGGRPEYGAALAGLAAGAVGVLLSRVVTAAAAGLGGALALGLGLLGCFPGEPLARELAGRPAVVLGFAVVLGIAGAALQLAAPATSPGDPAARSPGSRP